jgi:hypothetical protein
LIRYAFITVTDYEFFTGMLATVSSVLEFQPATDIFVINNERHALTAPQAGCLSRNSRVRLLDSSQLAAHIPDTSGCELSARV